jgi:hypothetical protein
LRIGFTYWQMRDQLPDPATQLRQWVQTKTHRPQGVFGKKNPPPAVGHWFQTPPAVGPTDQVVWR